jgi:hypothetical protein
MTTGRLTSPIHSAVGNANRSGTEAAASGTNAVNIPKTIAAKFVVLANRKGKTIFPANQKVLQTIVALCRGESPSELTARARDAAALLSAKGADHLFSVLQTSKDVPRQKTHERALGWAPSVKQQKQFDGLVKTFYGKLPEKNRLLAEALIQRGRGRLSAELVERVGRTRETIETYWRKIDFYTPAGLFHYLTLPSQRDPENQKIMARYHDDRIAQRDEPVAAERPPRKFLARKEVSKAHQSDAADRFVNEAAQGMSITAEKSLPKAVPRQDAILPPLPIPADLTLGANTRGLAKNQVPPVPPGAALSTPGSSVPANRVEMLDDFSSAFLDGLIHMDEK